MTYLPGPGISERISTAKSVREVMEFLGRSQRISGLALETGCAFNTDPKDRDNLSTPNIARHFCGPKGHLFSFDTDPARIEVAKQLLGGGLEGRVSFFVGDSMQTLPVFASIFPRITTKRLDILYLDSFEDPGWSHKEFRLVSHILRPGGIICADDAENPGSRKTEGFLPFLKERCEWWHVVPTPTTLFVGALR